MWPVQSQGNERHDTFTLLIFQCYELMTFALCVSFSCARSTLTDNA